MTHGIDSLVVTLQVDWGKGEFFETLNSLKSEAKQSSEPIAGKVQTPEGKVVWLFLVLPTGKPGYEWVLQSQDFTLSVGAWLKPISRPSITAEIRSEALWTHGPESMINRIRGVIAVIQGVVQSCKPSRVDLCVDVLLPESQWQGSLQQSMVTRALNISRHDHRRCLSGFSIGSGDMSARLYDKPLEIEVKSKKNWMYGVWGIQSVAKDHRIIRVEFQVRRKTLKEMALETIDDLWMMLDRLWAYCTRKWLRLVEDSTQHHTMQKPLPWWPVVEAGFNGAQTAMPLVRSTAKRVDIDQHVAQVVGNLMAIVAIDMDDQLEPGETLDADSMMAHAFRRAVKLKKVNDEHFTDRFKRKQARKHRFESEAKSSCAAPLHRLSLAVEVADDKPTHPPEDNHHGDNHHGDTS